MKKRRTIAALALAVAACSCISASAAKFGYEIDPAAMKELEQASTFEVQVTEKKVVEECLDTEMLDHNDDVLILTVTNNSDVPVRGVKVKYVAHDDQNLTAEVTGFNGSFGSFAGNDQPEIFSVESGEEVLEPGGVHSFVQAVDFSQFTGVRAIVEEYVLEDGTKVANPDYPAWENLAFGLGSGAVTELD